MHWQWLSFSCSLKVWLKAKWLQEWLFCLVRQNKYCLSNPKISYQHRISAMKIEKHRYQPQKKLTGRALILLHFELVFSQLYNVTLLYTMPVTSLGHQEGRRVFREGPKFFDICPIFLNYAQHIFPEGAKNFLGGASPPPGYGPALYWFYLCILKQLRTVPANFLCG